MKILVYSRLGLREERPLVMCFQCAKEIAKPDAIPLDDVVREVTDKGL